VGKLWPVLAGLLILLALALYFRRSAPATPPKDPKPGVPIVTPKDPEPIDPTVPPTTKVDDPPGIEAGNGSLRVVLEAPGQSFAGVVTVLLAPGKTPLQKSVFGSETESVLFEKLPVGPRRVLFIPSRAQAPVSAETTIPETGEAKVVLRLASASQLRGTVVDALQQPLAGVRVSLTLPGVFPVLAPGPGRMSFGGGVGRAGGGSSTSGSYAYWSDGSLRLSSTTGKDGTFSIGGLPNNAVTVEVSFEKIRFSQACVADREARIIVPHVPVPAAQDPAAVEFRRAADALLTHMLEHPEAEEAYWTQLKALIEGWISRPGVSPSDRHAVQDSIRKTDELRASLKK